MNITPSPAPPASTLNSVTKAPFGKGGPVSPPPQIITTVTLVPHQTGYEPTLIDLYEPEPAISSLDHPSATDRSCNVNIAGRLTKVSTQGSSTPVNFNAPLSVEESSAPHTVSVPYMPDALEDWETVIMAGCEANYPSLVSVPINTSTTAVTPTPIQGSSTLNPNAPLSTQKALVSHTISSRMYSETLECSPTIFDMDSSTIESLPMYEYASVGVGQCPGDWEATDFGGRNPGFTPTVADTPDAVDTSTSDISVEMGFAERLFALFE